MEIDFMILADAVASGDGKLYIHGGGWDTVLSPTFPAQPRMGVGIRLRIPWAETNEPHTMEIDVLNEEGQSIMPDPPGPFRGTINVGRPPQLAAGDDQFIPLAVGMDGLSVARPGKYVIIVRLDAQEAACTVFRVQAAPVLQAVVPQPMEGPPKGDV